MTLHIIDNKVARSHFKQIGVVLVSMLITFWVAMVPVAKVNGFNVLPWLDIPFHIWGGFLLGILAVRILILSEDIIDNTDHNTYLTSKILLLKKLLHRDRLEYEYRYLLFIVSFVIFWGVMWESWEYWMYVTHRVAEWGGVVDTCKDMFDDTVGAILAYMYNLKIINRNSE